MNDNRTIAHTEYTEPGRAHPRPDGRGAASLTAALLALVLTPVLVIFPFAGFVPVGLAATGVILGWRATRRNATGTARTGFVLSTIVLCVSVAAAALWTFFVVNPSIAQYGELHDAVSNIFSG